MKHILLLISFTVSIQFCFSQLDSLKSLVNETMLHPGDAFTAYVYKKGEFGYNQALTPYPSWAWWGITNRITTELDIEAWLGGVPSFNFRFGITQNQGRRPAIAFETMFQFLSQERDQFHNLDYLEINRQGSSWYNHINLSWKLRNSFHLHIAGGATYAENLSISNGDNVNCIGKTYTRTVHPDFSLGTDWRMKKWISIHSTISYGSTFLYADNIPRKQQFVLATRTAPFIENKRGFFNSLRIELAFLYANFEDAGQSIVGPIGFIYWQWDWSKEKRQQRNK